MPEPRNPKWTEEELILALNVFHDLPSSSISAKNEVVITLSELLNKLSAAERRNDNYRNANGAALKLHNFARLDSSRTSRGMTHGGRLEEVIWKRYEGRRSALKQDAEDIAGKLREAN